MEHQMNTGAEAIASLGTYVRQELQAGASVETVITRLEARGMARQTAERLVKEVQARTGAAGSTSTAGSVSFVPAAAGGLAAAVVGGVIWALIAIKTGYEIGWIAWGVGVLAGYAVVLFGGGGRGRSLQVMAVSAAFLGIAIGKYLTFFDALKAYVLDEYGAEAVAELSMFSLGAVQFFLQSVGSILSGFDALWIVLAVATAWGIPKVRKTDPAAVQAASA